MCACVGPDHLAIHHWLVVWSLLIQNLTASFVCWLVWHCGGFVADLATRMRKRKRHMQAPTAASTNISRKMSATEQRKGFFDSHKTLLLKNAELFYRTKHIQYLKLGSSPHYIMCTNKFRKMFQNIELYTKFTFG